jgi:hypothetical protein
MCVCWHFKFSECMAVMYSAYGFYFQDEGMQTHWLSCSKNGLLMSVLDLVQ